MLSFFSLLSVDGDIHFHLNNVTATISGPSVKKGANL